MSSPASRNCTSESMSEASLMKSCLPVSFPFSRAAASADSRALAAAFSSSNPFFHVMKDSTVTFVPSSFF